MTSGLSCAEPVLMCPMHSIHQPFGVPQAGIRIASRSRLRIPTSINKQGTVTGRKFLEAFPMPKKLPITIAGAVSLGSYAAGVLYDVLGTTAQHKGNWGDGRRRPHSDRCLTNINNCIPIDWWKWSDRAW